MLSERHQIKLYTPEEIALGNCILCGKIDHHHTGPKVFKASKINLNITLKSIETGIPLRAMDIMGAGGFLISNYQEDYLLQFEPGKDFVFYENIEDLLEKTAFYLRHDTEREKIAGNGHDKMVKEHTYSKRIAEMLSIPFPQR